MRWSLFRISFNILGVHPSFLNRVLFLCFVFLTVALRPQAVYGGREGLVFREIRGALDKFAVVEDVLKGGLNSSPDCQVCQDCLRFSEETRRHSKQHFSYGNAPRVTDLFKLVRPSRVTSMFGPEISYELIKRKIAEQGRRFVSLDDGDDRGTTGYSTTIQLNLGDPKVDGGYRLRVVMCQKTTCHNNIASTGERRRNAFKKGDVMTVYPECGPRVLVLPSREAYLRDIEERVSHPRSIPAPEFGIIWKACR